MATPADAPAPAAFVGSHAKLTRKIEQANLVFQLPALSATDPALSAMRLFGEILGRRVPARVVAYDLATGFGLLQALTPTGTEPAPIGASAEGRAAMMPVTAV